MKQKQFVIVIVVVLLITTTIKANCTQIPPFLPEYYSPVLESMMFVDKKSTNNQSELYIYELADRSVTLSIENIKLDRPETKAILNNLILHINKDHIKKEKGAFNFISEKEVSVEFQENQVEQFIYAFDTGMGVQIWTYLTKQKKVEWIKNNFKIIRSLTNRLRYENAVAEGNVAMGLWGPEIYDYASHLFEKGEYDEGLNVLKRLLATSPFNYQAHADLIEKTKNKEEAISSARIILKNAENGVLISKAASYLGVKDQTIESVPLLDEKETGLQLILIPLPPCSIRLLEESAKNYEKITGIPVKIRRLQESWILKDPERMYRQRDVQRFLIQQRKGNIDFEGWNKQKYVDALLKAAESEDALTRYAVVELIKKIHTEPGQYFIDPYLGWFLKALEKYSDSDNRTMYVGMTEVNIHSGDNNYIFSLYGKQKESHASILSYYMMTAKNLSEEYESRSRLTERIAKELVPASLKSLNIQRSTDPTCPYSYSSGVQRLDQKTLMLSDPVKKELEKIRLQHQINSADRQAPPASR